MRSLIAFFLIACGAPAQAAESKAGGKPAVVGMVADVQGDVRWNSPRKGQPDILDDLHEKDSLRVSAGARVALVYFADCTKESVKGKNDVRVGKTHSTVSDIAGVTKSEVSCEPPKTVTDDGTSSVPGALVLMGADDPKKRLEKADKAYREDIAKAPDDLAVLLSYAAFCEGQNRFQDARRLYQDALRLHPESRALKKRVAAMGAAEASSPVP